MNRFLYILLFLLLEACGVPLSIEPDGGNKFVKFFGSSGNQYGKDLVKLPDNGFMLLGETSSPNGNKVFLMKSDAFGNEEWSNIYAEGDKYVYSANSLTLTADGNVVVAATFNKGNDMDIMMLRVDLNGTKIDSAVYGIPGYDDKASHIIQSTDGGFVVLGTSFDESPNNLKYGITAWKTYPSSLDTLPQTEWQRTYSKGDESEGKCAIEFNGYYYFLGTSNANNPEQLTLNNLTLYPVNQYGGNLKNNYYGSGADDFAVKLVKTSGGFALLGHSVDGSSNYGFIELITDSFKSLDKYILNIGFDFTPTSFIPVNTGYAILGTAPAAGNPEDSNICLAYVEGGTTMWVKTFGGVEIDEGGKGIISTDDGSIVIIGTVELNNQHKIALIKTDKNGNLNIEK